MRAENGDPARTCRASQFSCRGKRKLLLLNTILFVCVHNAGRSQMAEALLNHLAGQKGLLVRAISAGTAAGSAVNADAIRVMEEIGISMDGHLPKQLSQEMADRASRIITMGCGVNAEACPARILVTDDWGLEDPAGKPIERVREIRDEILGRIETLLQVVEGR